jgi:hypothetical protein
MDPKTIIYTVAMSFAYVFPLLGLYLAYRRYKIERGKK